MKKAFFKTAAIILACLFASPLSAAALKGDVNGDGRVDRRDAELVFDYASGSNTGLTEAQKSTADVDGDGMLSVGDAAQILRYHTGTEEKLPANEVARLNILSPPYKLKYKAGDALNMEGFMLSVTYTNGQTKLINRYSYTGFDGGSGTKIITVSCRGKLISFTVAVDEPKLREIQPTYLPSKRSYTVGEVLSLAGLRLNGIYEDGTSKELTGYSVSGYSGEAGLHTVKLMYMGKTSEFTVGCGNRATVRCGGTRLNVRTGAGTSYQRIGAFLEGSSIIVTDLVGKDGWVQCWGLDDSGNYIHGWCLKAHLSIST
ncbi:MAG: hypothetical protein E7597_06840 [Ruminococcaceae bacterium]|nr:hypothetical protein [Oscillospiraceae bacterium]